MPRPLAAPLAALALALPAAARPQAMLGPDSCKPCHAAAYESWRDGPHARALESLPEASRKDARCTSCHAPDLDKGVAAVSCETCHGPGQAYAARYVMRDAELARAVGLVDPGEKTCLACHTDSAPSLTRFDYARKVAVIAHGEADRASRSGEAARPPARPRR